VEQFRKQDDSADAPRTWKVGDVIADLYEVTGVLGEGAFGIVHKVHHRGWDMDLAVKSPKEEILGDELAVRRFLREAETWVSLGLHPHIASCYYVRNLGGIPRLFIEYVDGGTLRDWLQNGKVKDWHTILDIAIQICYGLSFAHKKGLVHRDLKPGNCLMTSDGTLKITDFGLVKLLQSDVSAIQAMECNASALHQPNVLRGTGTLTGLGRMGTPEYMAPEQWFSPAEATAAADIWAFGLIFYELTCGRRPFEMLPDEPLDAFYARRLKSNWAYRNPRELRDGVTKRQAEVIARCLAPKVEERTADIDVVAAEIDQLYSELVEVLPPKEVKPELPFLPSELSEQLPLMASARRPPPEIPALSDTNNNQAVSLMDLGRENEALQLFEYAIKAAPDHTHAIFNQGLLLWRAGKIADDEVLRRLDTLRSSRPGDYEVPYFTALCHVERGDLESAAREFEEAVQMAKTGGRIPECDVVQRARERLMRDLGKSGKCLRVLEGHKEHVTSASMSPDGRYGLSASWDGTLRLWDLSTGWCVRVIEVPSRNIKSACEANCLSPDGQRALSGSTDGLFRLWDIQSGTCLLSFEGFSCCACISPDAQHLLSGGWDKTLRLWELATGTCLKVLEGHTGCVSSVCFDPSGRYALSGSLDKTLRLWELATGRCVRVLEGHDLRVNSVCISRGGRYGLSGSSDKTLRYWEFATGACLRTLCGHTDEVWSAAIGSDGRLGLSGGRDDTVRLWDLSRGRCLRTFVGHDSSVMSVCISSDGRLALSGSYDKTLRLWSVVTGESAVFSVIRPRSSTEVGGDVLAFRSLLADADRALEEGHPADAMVALQNARRLTRYGPPPAVRELLDRIGASAVRTGLSSIRAVSAFPHPNRITSLRISAEGRYGLSGDESGVLRLWDLPIGTCIRTFEGHADFVSTLAISPDRRLALSSGSSSKIIRVWDLASGQSLATLEGHTGWIRDVDISPDGRLGLSASADGSLRLWDLTTGKCMRTFEGHGGDAASVCFSPEGRFGLSGGHDKTVRLWDLASGMCLRILGGDAPVTSVFFSADARDGFSLDWGDAPNSTTLRRWSLASGECLSVIEGHSMSLGCISPDGRFGILNGKDNGPELWDISSQKLVRTFAHFGSSEWLACISSTGRYGLSVNDDVPTMQLLEFDWECEFPEPKDWDDGARPYLRIFLTLHTRVGLDCVSRVGKPVWNDDDFKKLLVELGYRGYGWLRPGGVRRQLEEMTREWKGPPAL
jgi:WD40 repeat protein